MLIVDTYNVLHVTGVLPPAIAGPDAFMLAGLIAQSRYRGDETLLVCDGTKPRDAPTVRFDHIRLVYGGPRRESADAKIERTLETRRGPSVLVVSSDRRIRLAARRARAKWMASDRFLAVLAEDHRTGIAVPERNTLRDSIPLADADVRRWMRIFGIEEQGVRDLMAALDNQSIEHPAPTDPPSVEERSKPKPARTQEPQQDHTPPEPDPLLDRLLRDTPVDPADLDMRKWLDDTDRRTP